MNFIEGSLIYSQPFFKLKFCSQSLGFTKKEKKTEEKSRNIKRTKSEKKEKRASQGKYKSAPSSSHSSTDKKVYFGTVPEEIEEAPRVMRRGTKPTQEKEYEKRKYYSDDE